MNDTDGLFARDSIFRRVNRESVLLYDYAGLSHEDIARTLGVTHDAARKRHSRALAALGKALGDRLR